MRQILFASLLALGACTTTHDKPPLDDTFGGFGKADVFSNNFGTDPNGLEFIAPGTPKDVDYTNPPRYRALRYAAAQGDNVDIRVSAPGQTGEDADPVAWLLDSRFEIVTKNDDASADDPSSHLTATNLDAGTYYVVFRERSLQRATFEVALKRDGNPGVTLLHVGDLQPWMKFREGDGAWRDPMKTGQDTYFLPVAGPYEVVLACADASSFRVDTYERTPSDDAGPFTFDCSKSTTTPAQVAVTGTLAQAGTVTVGYTTTGPTAAGPFTLNVDPGTYDVAAGDNSHLVIQRGVAIQAATSLAAIDFSHGIALQQVAVAVTGAPATATVASDFYSSSNGWFEWMPAQPSDPLPVVPLSALTSGDVESISVSDSDDTHLRWVSADYTGQASIALAMPNLVDAVSFPTANGAALPLPMAVPADVNRIVFTARVGSNTVALHKSASFVHATSKTLFLFDAPTGFNPAWTIDLSKPYRGTLTLYQVGGPQTSESSYRASVNGPAPTPPPARSDLTRDRAHVR